MDAVRRPGFMIHWQRRPRAGVGLVALCDHVPSVLLRLALRLAPVARVPVALRRARGSEPLARSGPARRAAPPAVGRIRTGPAGTPDCCGTAGEQLAAPCARATAHTREPGGWAELPDAAARRQRTSLQAARACAVNPDPTARPERVAQMPAGRNRLWETKTEPAARGPAPYIVRSQAAATSPWRRSACARGAAGRPAGSSR